MDVARLLVDHLNAEDGNWSAPAEPEVDNGPDAVAVDLLDRKLKLEIQVVRVLPEAEWRTLAREGVHEIPTGVAGLAGELLSAARKKFEKYPVPQQRAEMTLILDVSRTVGHTFRQVIDAFRRDHASTCRGLGFSGVWLVGHRREFVECLDLDP